MNNKKHLICPKCHGTDFEVKKEATYVYTYELANSLSNDSALNFEPLPFLFDKRDMLNSSEYIQCKGCSQQYFYDFTNNTIKDELTTLKKAVLGKTSKFT